MIGSIIIILFYILLIYLSFYLSFYSSFSAKSKLTVITTCIVKSKLHEEML